MFTKSKEKEEKISKNNKKRNIILIVAGLLLLIVILFLLWYFNRKFDVVFDYNNGKTEEILVKYKNSISEKDVVGKEKLGEEFLGWYLVTIDKDGKEILSSEPFDFTTSIKNNIKLKAVFKEKEEKPVVKEEKPKKEEKITIKFDSNGGSLVSSISLKKGSALTLPKNPTRDGYTFNEWQTKDGKSVKNKTKFSSNTTLYAKWTKNEEPKIEEPKPEKITLSLSRDTIHYNGIKTAKASAKVENATGDVTYSLSNTLCMGIDAKTGVITAKNNGACSKGAAIKVYAKTPSGTTAEQTIYYEKDLELTSKGESYSKYASFYGDSNGYYVTANQNVTWDVTLTSSVSYEYTYKDFISKTSTSVKGGYTFDTIVASTGAISRVSGDVRLHAKTKAEQKFFVDIKRETN